MKKVKEAIELIEEAKADRISVSGVLRVAMHGRFKVNGLTVETAGRLFEIDLGTVFRDDLIQEIERRIAGDGNARYGHLTRLRLATAERTPTHEPVIEIRHEALAAIEYIVGSQPAECRGLLIGTRKNPFRIEEFCFDRRGSRSGGAYDPDYRELNRVLKRVYEPRGLDFLGFVHSHPAGVKRPSGDWGNNQGDLAYCQALLEANPDLSAFLMPIVMTVPDTGRFDVIPYVVYRDQPDRVIEASLKIA